MSARHRKTATVLALGAIVAGMAGLTAASVPLYRLFCQVTGYGGTPERVDAVPAAAVDETITVRFNADVDPDLPWSFRPAHGPVTVRLGEQHLAFFEAVNNADHPVVGNAVFNVTPFKTGAYFDKIHCFCFEEQVLGPGERVEMPVSFYVDPAIRDDRNTREVRTITLSYTFFLAPDQAPARKAGTGEVSS